MTHERWTRLLERLEHLPEHLWHELEEFLEHLLRLFSHHDHPQRGPAAPTLTSTLGVSMSTVTLVVTLPTARQDGTSLDITEIASVVYQKTSLMGSPPVASDPVILATNLALNGAGPVPGDLTYIDTAPVVGDVYSAYVTDTLGHIGLPSNTYTVPATLAVPAAPVLTATFAA